MIHSEDTEQFNRRADLEGVNAERGSGQFELGWLVREARPSKETPCCRGAAPKQHNPRRTSTIWTRPIRQHTRAALMVPQKGGAWADPCPAPDVLLSFGTLRLEECGGEPQAGLSESGGRQPHPSLWPVPFHSTR